jgi:hypothetical protein
MTDQDPEGPEYDQTEQRLSAMEAEQERQGGLLQQILGRLPGKGAAAPTGGPSPAAPDAGQDIGELVRKGVAEIQAKQQADADAAAAQQQADDWRKSVDARLAERRPAEPVTGVRARMQRALFGSHDQR